MMFLIGPVTAEATCRRLPRSLFEPQLSLTPLGCFWRKCIDNVPAEGSAARFY